MVPTSPKLQCLWMGEPVLDRQRWQGKNVCEAPFRKIQAVFELCERGVEPRSTSSVVWQCSASFRIWVGHLRKVEKRTGSIGAECLFNKGPVALQRGRPWIIINPFSPNSPNMEALSLHRRPRDQRPCDRIPDCTHDSAHKNDHVAVLEVLSSQLVRIDNDKHPAHGSCLHWSIHWLGLDRQFSHQNS